ncbi:hypothetical protein [Nannocystis exedens]|uniref:hypothetical protein n=1 Tax=Nannocystis exedens TaxID=54 RepID=UPI000BBA0815|nr:hypothetical protein [Nannocystis exedens]PCC68815.1 hypothetical protein NAEX_01835 [Nannocystis exedens]
MTHIGTLGKLWRLTLKDVETFTDEGYRQLENLTHLRLLLLFAPLVTLEAQARLHAHLPRLWIDCSSSGRGPPVDRPRGPKPWTCAA